MLDTSIQLAGIKFSNPTILASGILGTSKQVLERLIKNGAGGVTTKSITLEPRKGHDSPIIAEFESGMLNAVGYANPGIAQAKKEFSEWNHKEPLILSLTAKNTEEFSKIVEQSKGIPCNAIELAISCPHTPGYGTLAGQSSPESTEEITRAAKKKTKLPLIIKLSPNVPALGEVAKAAEKGGADIINMGNTAGPGMIIDLERKKPVLHFQFGGMSGPAIKPLMVRCVYDVYKSVKIPIIGTGGVTYGKDAIEMFMAGASAVGIGTAIHYRGMDAFKKINQEIKEWMKSHNYNSIKSIIGAVHE